MVMMCPRCESDDVVRAATAFEAGTSTGTALTTGVGLGTGGAGAGAASTHGVYATLEAQRLAPPKTESTGCAVALALTALSAVLGVIFGSHSFALVGWVVFVAGTVVSMKMANGLMTSDQEKNAANSSVYNRLWYCRRCGTQADEDAFWRARGE